MHKARLVVLAEELQPIANRKIIIPPRMALARHGAGRWRQKDGRLRPRLLGKVAGLKGSFFGHPVLTGLKPGTLLIFLEGSGMALKANETSETIPGHLWAGSVLLLQKCWELQTKIWKRYKSAGDSHISPALPGCCELFCSSIPYSGGPIKVLAH
jgi:hypothetical protein